MNFRRNTYAATFKAKYPSLSYRILTLFEGKMEYIRRLRFKLPFTCVGTGGTPNSFPCASCTNGQIPRTRTFYLTKKPINDQTSANMFLTSFKRYRTSDECCVVSK